MFFLYIWKHLPHMEDVFVNKRNLSPFALMQTFFDSGKNLQWGMPTPTSFP